jgi:xanthine dehydrogenase YagS FAD-binding subunit
MKEFEYAAPRSETEVLELLSPEWGQTEILAGGTDLVGLMKKMIVTPSRVVNIKEVPSLRGIHCISDGVRIGAATTLDDLLDSDLLEPYPAIKQVIRNISAIQFQSQGTLGGELLQRPQCWYFRSGHGLLAQGGQRVTEGDGRYHAIFGNTGPAKFVHASRLAPALIALGAVARIVGPKAGQERLLPIADLYRTPRDEGQRETVLAANQLLTHVLLPGTAGWTNAAYEVRHGEGPDYPLAAAAAALRVDGGIVRHARVVLGQVAPTPWVSREASRAIIGQHVDDLTAQAAGEAAVQSATPLKDNAYKVQLARVSVKRATLLAAGLETGGF